MARDSKALAALTRARIPHVEEYYDLLEYETAPLGGYRLRRNQRLPHVTINENGYRGKPLSGSETILLLGDSVTFGVGASSDHACFSRFLEAVSQQPTADASVRAYRVSQHYGRLPILLQQLPMLQQVFLWCGYVDLVFWVISGGSIEGAFHFGQKYAAGSSRVGISAYWMRFLQKVHRGRPAVSNSEPEAGTLEELVTQVMTHIRAIRDLLTARGIDFSVLLQPFIRTRPKEPQLQFILDGYDQKAREKFGTGWYDLSDRFIDLFRSELQQNVPDHWVDCQSFVTESDFLDQVHLKEGAAEKIARCVVQKQFSI
ncbi:MAG: hypothetical protein HY211_06305 [Candidatus Omnitrophica bacterium]|nr:hypothetical protein [Candidatus Omnitrophota bacterium]